MSMPAKIIAVVCLLVGGFVAGNLASRRPAAPTSSASTSPVLYWACPMHPHYKSDHPGDAPCCGMRLEPVYAGSKSGSADMGLPPGALAIGAAQQQLIGVRTGEVERAPASHRMRVPGRVTVDEARSYRIIAATDGWIRTLGQNPAGTFVKENQILASYYARDLLSSQQSLAYALNTSDQLRNGQLNIGAQPAAASLNVQIAIDSLRNLGMSDLQIREIQRTRVAASEINVYSPTSGFVISRNVSPGQRFEKGAEHYRIADVAHVWVMTDIFEKDREFLKPEARATVHYRGRTFQARMSHALPQFDPQSRTLKTRFEVDNPGFILGPDMFVDVELDVNMPAALTVPSDAILDTGRRKTVFVDRGDGYFEPRTVETGWRLGDRVQITQGLEPGERIVVSGNFLIDSESRMKLTPVGAPSMAEKAAAGKDPVCGMDVDPKDAKAIKTEHGGTTYYFCSDHCKRSFEANPGKYVPQKKDNRKRAAREARGGRGPA